MDNCPKCHSDKIIGVEYHGTSPQHYDGISEYQCLDCHYRQGRWTGKELLPGFVEPRHGKGDEPVAIRIRTTLK